MRTLSLCNGLWIPGVSRNAICPRDSLRIPTMRLRVVCGLEETIETLWPRIRLRRVDLPALGRPTMATTPKRPSPGASRHPLPALRGEGSPDAPRSFSLLAGRRWRAAADEGRFTPSALLRFPAI